MNTEKFKSAFSTMIQAYVMENFTERTKANIVKDVLKLIATDPQWNLENLKITYDKEASFRLKVDITVSGRSFECVVQAC